VGNAPELDWRNTQYAYLKGASDVVEGPGYSRLLTTHAGRRRYGGERLRIGKETAAETHSPKALENKVNEEQLEGLETEEESTPVGTRTRNIPLTASSLKNAPL
jgi:hypothetical protein